MAYNKAKEEKKWRLWKEAEEKQLRNLDDIVARVDKALAISVALEKMKATDV